MPCEQRGTRNKPTSVLPLSLGTGETPAGVAEVPRKLTALASELYTSNHGGSAWGGKRAQVFGNNSSAPPLSSVQAELRLGGIPVLLARIHGLPGAPAGKPPVGAERETGTPMVRTWLLPSCLLRSTSTGNAPGAEGAFPSQFSLPNTSHFSPASQGRSRKPRSSRPPPHHPAPAASWQGRPSSGSRGVRGGTEPLRGCRGLLQLGGTAGAFLRSDRSCCRSG